MRFTTIAAPLLLALTSASSVSAGLIAYGLCQTGCNAVAVACYGAAGVAFGTVAAALAPPAIVACNTALGTCSTMCASVALLAPIP